MSIIRKFVSNYKKPLLELLVICKKLPDKIAQLSRYVRIQKRLLVFFILLTSVPLISIGILSYSKSSSAVESKTQSYSSEIMSQFSQNVKNMLFFIESSGREFMRSEDFIELLNKYDGGELPENELTYQIDPLIVQKFSPSVMDGCEGAIYISKGRYLAGASAYHVSMDFENNAKEFESIASQAKGKYVWMMKKGSKTSQNYIVSVVELYNELTNTTLGTLVVFFNEAFIGNIYKSINIDGSKDIFLVDTSGTVISSKNTESIKINTKYTNENLIKHLNNTLNEKNASKNNAVKKGHLYLKDDGKEFLNTFAQVPDSNWFVVATIPTAFIQSESVAIRTTIFYVSLILFILAIIISIFIAISISSPLRKLESLMQKATEGNLNISITDNYKDEISNLSNNFNNMITNIRMLVTKVNTSSNQVLSSAEKLSNMSYTYYTSSEQIAVSMDEIAKGATDQAANNYKSLEYVTELSDDIKKVGNDMKTVTEIIYSTKHLSQNALETVKALTNISAQTSKVSEDIVQQIKSFYTDMKEIEKIVKFIGNISEQTNLLSLNAAIEAARAGDAGKGFAVVAEEVRKLADKTKESLTSINNSIQNIQLKAETTFSSANKTQEIVVEQLNAVNETDNSFKEIFRSMENISDFTREFEVSVNKILQSSVKTLETINNISTVSQETAATIEEITATTQQQIEGISEVSSQSKLLNDMAQELNKSISHFKV
ncbi:methyl-accepting chemotaxis protein [Pseudobacteroides cellulosolvens]|uniref:Methyl-accepting chemotaxis sensory transducer n=1 Tax=Pseudobacteroides cellulosolvens ATCC 35603 = DSM 2933 TaxID=398512 RepID=A0A0L6JSN3_9FIRM|nr:methyl-accepting chemotaxis protein [Pseudobacteroides cellulosolvens]KNY28437.1 methyl-accepting chemotaxis sensory transducer [Pseudobacteroides cellulosolvens ATCC 35603 = DSM 2933]